MKQKLNFSIFVGMLLIGILTTTHSSAQSIEWGNDVNVDYSLGKYYKNVRVACAYDGTIFIGRMEANNAAGPYQSWSVYKSVDGGINWAFYTSGSVTGTSYFSSFDIITAGENEANFKLYIARAVVDPGTNEAKIYGSCFDSAANSTSLSFYGETYTSSGTTGGNKGYVSMSWATDSRVPAAYSSPYTITLVAAKWHSPQDSLIAWTSRVGGTSFLRDALLSSSDFIRKVDASIGTSPISDYARLGIVYETHAAAQDSVGKLWVTYKYADDLSAIFNGGPHAVGQSSDKYSNPTIALSQVSGSGTGSGYSDFRTVIAYEHLAGANNKNVIFRTSDALYNGTADFTGVSDGIEISGLSGHQVRPHMIYDSKFKNFLLTFYDQEAGQLPYVIKGLSSPANDGFGVISSNYRDADTDPAMFIEPRVEMRLVSNMAIFGWNDNGKSMFDAEYAIPSSVAEQTMNANDVLIYPNPANESTRLKLTTSLAEKVNLQIIDITGRLMSEQTLTLIEGTQTIQINTADLTPGNYLIRLIGNNTQLTSQVNITR